MFLKDKIVIIHHRADNTQGNLVFADEFVMPS